MTFEIIFDIKASIEIIGVVMKSIGWVCMVGIGLAGCGPYLDGQGYPTMFSPKPLYMRGLPQGSDGYSLGFREGCYHFIGQTGNGFQRFYDRAPDPSRLDDELYRQGYRDGDRYCGVYVNKGIIL